ncbi:MAG: Peptidase U34 dipeptidase [Synergistales bacterium 58_81]|nr:MAG: Peptidase U34 dipeptidase [Synergistales bacterium 57_84]KUK88624.1 MAG: Peptidase U34 dipeptidase [Synergistales bacterium 58_81]
MVIDYAIERGWYDPKSGKPFDFAEAYSAPAQGKALERGYDTRQWIGQKLLTGKTPEGPLPFAVKPAEKVGVRDVMNILRNHHEGTPYDKTEGYRTSPHWTDERVICTSTTHESSVTQLRDNVPAALKAVYWRTSGRPCTSPYVPWYLGITAVPEGHFWAEPTVGSSLQFKPHAALYDYDRTKAWWTFQDLENIVDAQYGFVIGKVQKAWQNFEEETLAKQAEVEKEACRLLAKDEAAGRAYLTRYTNRLAQKAWQQAKELIGELPTMKVEIPRKVVRLSETGTLQVNIISSGELSAKNIDHTTLTLGPAYRDPNTWVPVKSSALKDVDGDGDPDLTLAFELPPLLKLISPACYTDLWLHGSTKAGTPIVGRDLVNFLE